MNNQPRPPKVEIMVFKVNYEDYYKTKDAFGLIKSTHAAMNYPFGFGPSKLTLHGPYLEGERLIVYATIKMTVDKYFRKCANSESDALKETCRKWIQAYNPDKMSYFGNLCEMYSQIRKNNKKRMFDREVL